MRKRKPKDSVLHRENKCAFYDNVEPPNTALELTPQSGPNIAAIVTAGFGSIAYPIYWGGAAQRQAVGRISDLHPFGTA